MIALLAASALGNLSQVNLRCEFWSTDSVKIRSGDSRSLAISYDQLGKKIVHLKVNPRNPFGTSKRVNWTAASLNGEIKLSEFAIDTDSGSSIKLRPSDSGSYELAWEATKTLVSKSKAGEVVGVTRFIDEGAGRCIRNVQKVAS